jgi:signal transduction histidine kinase
MSQAKLKITGPEGTSEAQLDPKGVTIGRGANCDVVFDHETVSRLHARIYRDPFGRWIAEDLDSHNGVLINGERIKARAVSPGQKIEISHFSLSIRDEDDEKTAAGTSLQTTIPIVDRGLEENIVSYRAEEQAILSPVLMQHLNELTGHLTKLPGPSELYSEACLYLANILDTLVAIVRLPPSSQPLPKYPEILACHFGGSAVSAYSSTPNLHLSRRVLEAVRSSDAPVMARSGPSSDKHMVLTIVDESSPHVVFAARVNEFEDNVDGLYVDILENKSPKEMFDFIEVVARQINLAQKSLFFAQLQKQERALRQANTQLKEKDRIKDEYVSRVTHDIKGHLAAISSCLFIGADESSGKLSEKQADFLSRATKRTAQLTDFVKELLNLTQMRLSGRVKTEPFSLPQCISKALETVERKANDKSIALTSSVDDSIGEIVGDQFSTNEMISNLLFNAIKYTPENKTVHLEAKDLADSVQIDFVDTGIGIPAGEIENIFDEFFRASNAKKREKDGTGLGLSIVKQIIDRHGGKISVKSTEGRGTTFTVILPKNKKQ